MTDFPGKSPSTVSDDHLRAIGAVVVNWSSLEMVMEIMILGLYQISPDRGLVITANLSFQNKLTILRILASQGAIKDPEEAKLCTSLLKKVEEAHLKRNVIDHGLWSQGRAQGLATRHAIRVRGRRLVTVREQVPLFEIEDTARLFLALRIELSELADRVGARPAMPDADHAKE